MPDLNKVLHYDAAHAYDDPTVMVLSRRTHNEMSSRLLTVHEGERFSVEVQAHYTVKNDNWLRFVSGATGLGLVVSPLVKTDMTPNGQDAANSPKRSASPLVGVALITAPSWIKAMDGQRKHKNKVKNGASVPDAYIYYKLFDQTGKLIEQSEAVITREAKDAWKQLKLNTEVQHDGFLEVGIRNYSRRAVYVDALKLDIFTKPQLQLADSLSIFPRTPGDLDDEPAVSQSNNESKYDPTDMEEFGEDSGTGKGGDAYVAFCWNHIAYTPGVPGAGVHTYRECEEYPIDRVISGSGQIGFRYPQYSGGNSGGGGGGASTASGNGASSMPTPFQGVVNNQTTPEMVSTRCAAYKQMLATQAKEKKEVAAFVMTSGEVLILPWGGNSHDISITGWIYMDGNNRIIWRIFVDNGVFKATYGDYSQGEIATFTTFYIKDHIHTHPPLTSLSEDDIEFSTIGDFAGIGNFYILENNRIKQYLGKKIINSNRHNCQ
jgi:hypothetical protein